jgi:serine/threonine-protein kinase
VLLAVTIGAIGWWFGSGRWTTVPQLAGLERDAAIGQLQEAGLDPDCCEQVFSETVPAGQVISADPADGDAIRGTDVHLVVSKGAERFQVDPAWVGLPVEDVRARVAEAQLPLQFTEQTGFSDTVPAGDVIGFTPDPGTDLQRDTAVTILVSQGHAPVGVPNVIGQSADAAQDTLEQLHFTVEQTTGRSPDVDTGEVMAVTPGIGEEAPYGSTVTIQVSEGLPRVTVPDVRGEDADDATAQLEALGLEVEVQTFIAGSTVRFQNPSSGDVVDWGTTVRLLVVA